MCVFTVMCFQLFFCEPRFYEGRRSTCCRSLLVCSDSLTEHSSDTLVHLFVFPHMLRLCPRTVLATFASFFCCRQLVKHCTKIQLTDDPRGAQGVWKRFSFSRVLEAGPEFPTCGWVGLRCSNEWDAVSFSEGFRGP